MWQGNKSRKGRIAEEQRRKIKRIKRGQGEFRQVEKRRKGRSLAAKEERGEWVGGKRTDWKGLKAGKIDEDENESRGRFLEVEKTGEEKIMMSCRGEKRRRLRKTWRRQEKAKKGMTRRGQEKREKGMKRRG
jgi:hypothetical protein